MASGEMSRPEFTAFLQSAMAAARKSSLPGSLAYWFMDWRHLEEILAAGTKAYDELLNLCVWTKTNAGMGSFYRSAYELIFLFKSGMGSHRNNVQLGKSPTGPDSHLTLELKQITVNENGQRKRISKSEALMTQLVNKAISGEPAAVRIVFRHLERVQTRLDAVAAAQPTKQQSSNPKDYTDEELLALIASELPILMGQGTVPSQPDRAPSSLPESTDDLQLSAHSE